MRHFLCGVVFVCLGCMNRIGPVMQRGNCCARLGGKFELSILVSQARLMISLDGLLTCINFD